MQLLKKYRLGILGALFGALLGYLYYHFVGCASGTCAITSSPINSSAYGALMGSLAFSSLKNEK
jgi:phage shock protein E